MIENLPDFIPDIFILTVLATLLLFYFALTKSTIDHPKSKANFIVLFNVLWLIIQAVLALSGFYQHAHSFPPRFIVAVLPPLLIIAALFILQEGRIFIDGISLKFLTCIHTVRIPVELVLYWLFLNKAVPQLMTFEGRNFDIIAGITAPLAAFFWIRKEKINRKALLIWNCVSLLLLLNIAVNAVLAAPFSFQKQAFDQPNIAILYFPFVWLPAFIVPVVFFSHLVSIRQLRKMSD